MKCKKCGTKLKDDSYICLECGFNNGGDYMGTESVELLDEEDTENKDEKDNVSEPDSNIELAGDKEDILEKIEAADKEPEVNPFSLKEEDTESKDENDNVVESDSKIELAGDKEDILEKIEAADKEPEVNSFSLKEEDIVVKDDVVVKEAVESNESASREVDNNEKSKPVPVEIDQKQKKEDLDSYNILINNEDSLKKYIGPEYTSLKKNIFNIFAFLFSWFYFLYKELYLTGIIGLMITWLVSFFLRDYFIYYLLFISSFLGFAFNQYYLFICKKKMEKSMNDNEDGEEVVLKRDTSGTRIAKMAIIISIFLFVFCIGMKYGPSKEKGFDTSFWDDSTENLANCLSATKAAYSRFSTEKVGELVDAVCKVTSDDPREYEIYMKTELRDEMIYSYFYTEKGYVSLKNSTIEMNELLKKEANKTLSLEEEEKLEELKKIMYQYQDTYNQSLREDTTIRDNGKIDKKMYYFLPKEEIIR